MDFIYDPYLVLYLPMYRLDGASFRSRDAYGHLCTAAGSLWRPDGRRFDGIDDKVDIPYTSILNPNQFTLSLWVKVTGGQGTDRSPVTSRQAMPSAGGYIFYARSTNVWEFWIGNVTWGNTTGGSVVLNEWTYLTATYNNGTTNHYENGVFKGKLTKTLLVNSSKPFRIGAGATEGTGDFWFPGTVGEVALYRRALTPLEIQHNYVATKWRYR